MPNQVKDSQNCTDFKILINPTDSPSWSLTNSLTLNEVSLAFMASLGMIFTWFLFIGRFLRRYRKSPNGPFCASNSVALIISQMRVLRASPLIAVALTTENFVRIRPKKRKTKLTNVSFYKEIRRCRAKLTLIFLLLLNLTWTFNF